MKWRDRAELVMFGAILGWVVRGLITSCGAFASIGGC